MMVKFLDFQANYRYTHRLMANGRTVSLRRKSPCAFRLSLKSVLILVVLLVIPVLSAWSGPAPAVKKPLSYE